MRILRHNLGIYLLMAHGMLDPVVLRRNRWKKIPWAFLWERHNVEDATLILFNSPAEERKARQSGWSLRRTFVFPHIVELEYWKVLPPRSQFERQFPQVRGSEVILFAGRINWVKNLDKLIEALAIVRQKRPSAILVCVGPDTDGHRAELERRAYASGIHKHVLFTGLLEGEDLKAAYARGDVFALVSQKENFGLAVADALASGLPAVVSEGVDFSQDWVSEGPVRRVSPRPEAIATALIDLLQRSASRGLPDTEAREFAEREWGESRIPSLMATWQSLLPEKKPASIKRI
jgi:glycosyltransferase involved in cell wall biosynthesis